MVCGPKHHWTDGRRADCPKHRWILQCHSKKETLGLRLGNGRSCNGTTCEHRHLDQKGGRMGANSHTSLWKWLAKMPCDPFDPFKRSLLCFENAKGGMAKGMGHDGPWCGRHSKQSRSQEWHSTESKLWKRGYRWRVWYPAKEKKEHREKQRGRRSEFSFENLQL